MAGLVVLADVAATLIWKEPITALLQSRSQARLEREFDALKNDPDRPKNGAELAAKVGFGQGIGRIEIPKIGLAAVFVQGTDEASLMLGPGHYPETDLPGEGGLIAIAGHRTTYGAPFGGIDLLDSGDKVKLIMPYGIYRYRYDETQIVDPSDRSVLEPEKGVEQLVLSACHPPYSAAERIVVTLDLISVERGAPRVDGTVTDE